MAPGRRPSRKLVDVGAGIIPEAIWPVHSPRLWPAMTSGSMPSAPRASASRRPTATMPRPWRSSGASRRSARPVPRRGRAARPRRRPAARTPARRRGTGRPPCRPRRPGRSGSNQTSLRPRNARAPLEHLAGQLRAARASGSTMASRAGPAGGHRGSDRRRRRRPAVELGQQVGGVGARPAAARPRLGRRAARSAAGRRAAGGRRPGRDRAARSAGRARSSTTWALMPPKPKALTPATPGRRRPPTARPR